MRFIRSTRILTAALMMISLLRAPALAQEPRAGFNGILFYGDSLVERLSESGHMEAWMQLAQPEAKLRLRSLAWTGDEVGHRLRPEGFPEHLKNLLALWPARTVVLGSGMNESFRGAAGLAEFRIQLDAYVRELQRRHPGARVVLLSPIAVEDGFGDGRPDAAARNRDIALYVRVIRELAGERGLGFVDLFDASQRAYASHAEPLTTQGIHPNEQGARLLGRVVATGLLGDALPRQASERHLEELAKAASQKAGFVADVVRVKNADVYYGVRKRPDEYAAEMPRFHQLIDAAESIVHQIARSPERTFASFPVPMLPPMPEGKRRDAGKGTGRILRPAEAQAEFTVAPGYRVNLFASEEQFPDLRNPVQIDFDARGRLWVATMPSFPHTVPGRPREDKILVLEDTDRDGRADRQTVFAAGMDALDGLAFHEDGVLVSEQPRIWLMRDTDGDGRADTRRELIRGIDVTDSHHGGMIATDPAGHVWFSDGVFHRSQLETPFGVHRGVDSTTYRLNPRTGRVETEWQSITPNPWKITFDRTGNAFQMYGDGLVLDGLALTWTPLGVYHPFAYAQTVGYGKGSAAASISSPNFPAEYQQGMASAALLGSYAVSLTRYRFDEGMVRGSDRLDVLASPNPAFRPADLAFGFDGALYVSDYCSAIIGHAQHPMRDPQWDHDHGRIWRIVRADGPVETRWPRIEGASGESLCALLLHPQDIVRRHARIELRRHGAGAAGMVDSWLAGMDSTKPGFDEAALEGLFVLEGLGQTRPRLLEVLMTSKSALHRAASVRLIRLQAERLPNATVLLQAMVSDPHPRVQMEVIDAVAHLRPRLPGFEHVLHGFTARAPDVKRMLADLGHGTQPAKGRSVEVLEVRPETQVRHWLFLGQEGTGMGVPFDALRPKDSGPGSGVYRTWVDSDTAQVATLGVKHSFLDIRLNGLQVLSHDSQWSSEQQVSLELQKGLNAVEILFRKLASKPPAIHLFNPLGQPLEQARVPADPGALEKMAGDWARSRAGQSGSGAIQIQAVPGQMQFLPKQFTVRAGKPVRLVFTNPDLMVHNLVIVEAGAAEEVGLLADQLALQPNAMARGYVPETPKVLQSTPLVNPKGVAELRFTAPSKPGRYPFLCTFPGHWRLMRGVMVVEDAR